WPRTFAFYRGEDRSIWLQDLNLSPEQHERLAARLRWQALPENREYDYDHFADNCTTRVRDLIDWAADGRPRAQLGQRFPYTLRELALAGFEGLIGLQLATDLVLGHGLDGPLTHYQAGFLPRVLRDDLTRVRLADGQPLASPPRELYGRRAAPVISGQP